MQTSVNALEFVILDWGLMFNINSGCGGWRCKESMEGIGFLAATDHPFELKPIKWSRLLEEDRIIERRR